MGKRIEKFLLAKSILWNSGMTVALAWFEDNTIVINKGTDSRIKNKIKEVNSGKFLIKE